MNGKDMIMPMVTVTLPIYRKKYKAMQTEADFLKSANSQNTWLRLIRFKPSIIRRCNCTRMHSEEQNSMQINIV